MDELEALLTLESEPSADALPASDAGENRGRFAPTNISRAPASALMSPTDYRASVAAVCLPRIADGETVKALALEVDVTEDTLTRWLVQYDEDAYRKALAGQISAKLTHYAREAEQALADAAEAVEMTRNRELVEIESMQGDGISKSRSILLGVELAKAADARSKVAERGAKMWQWLGERRRPDIFRPAGADSAGASGGIRASFTFVIGGRPVAPRDLGRVLEAAPVESSDSGGDNSSPSGAAVAPPVDPA